MIEFDRRQFEEYARAVFTTDSPSGCTADAIALIKSYVEELGYTARIHNKGTLEVDVPGLDNSKTVATSAHIDTLGLMVRSVKSGGTLALTRVGGPLCPTLDGEYCTVLTREGKRHSGTILSLAPAAHVHPDAATMPRDVEHLEVRLDEEVKSAEDVKALGIDNGDFVFIDPKFTVTETGFLKSRFIDDKASAVLLLLLLRWCSEKKAAFRHPTRIYSVVFEEVGPGASAHGRDVAEFVTVDMGCVGLDLAGNEYAVSICAKDSGGPYDYELTNRLIALAKKHGLPYTVDIFPFYGSDVGAAWHAGVDCKGALIGSGVCASHGMERTHIKGLEATLKLMYLYLCGEEQKGRASDGGTGKKTSALAEGDGRRMHTAAHCRNGKLGAGLCRRAAVRPAHRADRFAARQRDGGAGHTRYGAARRYRERSHGAAGGGAACRYARFAARDRRAA